jgi:hypothetical protein
MKRFKLTCVVAAVAAFYLSPVAIQAEAPRAARSVHLNYPAPKAEWYYNEVTVEKSVPGSYFMVCGFRHGYFGIQEQGNGRKVVLFSVWDPTRGDNPNQVAEEDRVEVLYHADDVLAKRFGGEGTGGQSFFEYPWKVGETYRCAVHATTLPSPSGRGAGGEGKGDGKTTFSGYIYLPEKKAWKHLVTFRTKTGGTQLESPHSFVEDFRRDTKSATQERRALFGNGWVRDTSGKWTPLEKARFTASGASWEAKETIDAGAVKDRFYLQTGGETKMSMKLNGTTECRDHSKEPPELPKD